MALKRPRASIDQIVEYISPGLGKILLRIPIESMKNTIVCCGLKYEHAWSWCNFVLGFGVNFLVTY